jgi:hypothetical protein
VAPRLGRHPQRERANSACRRVGSRCAWCVPESSSLHPSIGWTAHASWEAVPALERLQAAGDAYEQAQAYHQTAGTGRTNTAKIPWPRKVGARLRSSFQERPSINGQCPSSRAGCL